MIMRLAPYATARRKRRMREGAIVLVLLGIGTDRQGDDLGETEQRAPCTTTRGSCELQTHGGAAVR